MIWMLFLLFQSTFQVQFQTLPTRTLEPFVEVNPTSRYGRYSELLGSRSLKKVYRAFDQEEGIKVAWNQVKLRKFSNDPAVTDRLYSEVRLLKNLKNTNIISLYGFWSNDKNNTLNFIAEVCTSGNLREYRKKHEHVSIKALKKWSKQILKGLEYLHTHKPCIIHRDLNCCNVFVDGNVGQVKIGDLGFAAIVGKNHTAHSIIFGIPEFMAPELRKEDYIELVVIYSFRMCLLEMVTLEIPYMECDSVAKIYKKMTSGIRPQSLNKVKDTQVSYLLKDPFFEDTDDDEMIHDY